MRVDASMGTNHPYVNHRPQYSQTRSFSAALDETRIDSARQIDFTSMTRREMYDWLQDQFDCGKITHEDGFLLWSMTIRIPVDASNASVEAIWNDLDNDDTRYNFMQDVRDGIDGALSRNDKMELKRLEAAIAIMQRHQGKNIGVNNIRAQGIG